MLRLEGVRVSYGAICAVQGLDLHIGTGELVALLGPNGAGKTSTIGAISGLIPASGRVVLEATDISRLPN